MPYSAFAEDAQSEMPEQVKGRSIIVSYLETRKAKPEGGAELSTRVVPNKLIVYISADGNIFNRLVVGRKQKSSDQTSGSKDSTQFADRTAIFEKNKLTVANLFGGGKGSRVIEASFNESITKCTATVVVSVKGEFARQRTMNGTIDLLYSAVASDISCAIVEGNELKN